MNHTIKEMRREDVKNLFVGTNLIFWSLLLPPVIINIVAFSLPFIGYDSSPLFYFRFMYVLRGFPLFVGVTMITSKVWNIHDKFKPTGQWLLIFVSLGVVLWFISQLMVWVAEDELNVWIFRTLILFRNMAEFVGILIGLQYLERWSLYLENVSLAKKFDYYFWIYLTVALGMSVVDYLIDRPNYVFVFFTSFLFETIVYCWGFVLLYRFRHQIRCILKSMCIQCGYLLYGLPNPRCPECGTDIPVVVGDA